MMNVIMFFLCYRLEKRKEKKEENILIKKKTPAYLSIIFKKMGNVERKKMFSEQSEEKEQKKEPKKSLRGQPVNKKKRETIT
jgi:hypothetical protein